MSLRRATVVEDAASGSAAQASAWRGGSLPLY
jgi:hypothetical protein